MSPSILITQCLQNDFVKPLARHEPLPNALHIGHAESRRLMGSNAEQGPVARFLQWAYAEHEQTLQIVHILDWHDPDDPKQKQHLSHFGEHCIAGSAGAALAVETPTGRQVRRVTSTTLNDFVATDLSDELEQAMNDGALQRVGIVGVWTEAKVTFLAYELLTRYPQLELGVCSALTASSSVAQHHHAIEQLHRVLGVRVFSSAGRFADWLAGKNVHLPLPGVRKNQPKFVMTKGAEPEGLDAELLRYLFRDCREVSLSILDGGFSGNLVLGATGTDLDGHRQAPHVVKIGPQEAIGQERAHFERVEPVLGNCAPQLADFADFGDRGGLKYRYASLGGGFSTTFQKKYCAGIDLEEIERILNTVFGEQLGRLYAAAQSEHCNLFELYGFDEKWAAAVRTSVESVLGRPAAGETLDVAASLPGVYNVCRFYETDLARLPRDKCHSTRMAYAHGDLNGANIILDEAGNVWLIDFFHTRRTHVLIDLIKLENDLQYIFTPLASEEDLADACRLTDHLLSLPDLGKPPVPTDWSSLHPATQRAWETICRLRAFYPGLVDTDRSTLQLLVGQLRYAVHTLSFDEPSPLQLRWALYAAGRLAEAVVDTQSSNRVLRLDWLDEQWTAPGRLAMTILPGRRDMRRDLMADLDVLAYENVTHLVCLLSDDELSFYGVGNLLGECRARGIDVMQLPIRDQAVASTAQMASLCQRMRDALSTGARIVVHCVGGLGRTGTVVACLLQDSMDAEAAIAEVRRVRSPRAIESEVQLHQVRSWSRRDA